MQDSRNLRGTGHQGHGRPKRLITLEICAPLIRAPDLLSPWNHTRKIPRVWKISRICETEIRFDSPSGLHVRDLLVAQPRFGGAGWGRLAKNPKKCRIPRSAPPAAVRPLRQRDPFCLRSNVNPLDRHEAAHAAAHAARIGGAQVG